ncbi:hypothetical protein vseg_019513 [Gypsophila vaccaria]
MDVKQQNEWAEAQKIGLSFDLVEPAKKQLLFLAAVDRNRHLYEDHVLQRAIYRYNACWLPLLAKHSESPVSESPLVVPLDCEWIWHCHRLNPTRYLFDCKQLYGKLLGCYKVISSIAASEESVSATVEIWNKMYPEEPYELDINSSFSEDAVQSGSQNEKFTSYDLLDAVKRQIPFTYQLSKPHVSDDLFLQEAEARYKGFLHLIRDNLKNRVQRFSVPTYDVDLMWHTHLLYPVYYCKDQINIVGKVLHHDDTDTNRSKGGALDTGFTDTTKQWEETFGTRYWKAGTLYRGVAPTPVTHVPYKSGIEGKKSSAIENFGNLIVPLSERQAVEVFLECVEIKNVPEDHKDNLVVSFGKKQADILFNIKRTLTVSSESEDKQVAYFQCEPTGEFLFELKSESSKSSKVLGSCSLSLQELVSSRSQLSAEKWLTVDPVAGLKISEPILLHVSVSFTPPTPAPQVFHLGHSQDLLRFHKSSSLLPLLMTGYVTNDVGKAVLSLQMRTTLKDATKLNPDSELLKEVYSITDSGEEHKMAELLDNNWVIKGMHGSFTLQKNSGNDDHLFELVGDKMVKLFSGRRLDFEPKNYVSQRSEEEFITAVEFSADYPYGRAIALYDLKLGTLKALDNWVVLPGIILGFILPDVLERKEYDSFTTQTGGKVTTIVDLMNDAEKLNTSVNEVNNTGSARCLTPCSECDKKKIGIHGDGCGIPVSGGGCGIPVSSDKMNASVNDVIIGGSARCLTPCSECDKKKMGTQGGGCGIPVSAGAGCGIPVSGGMNFECNKTPTVVSTIMNDGEKMNASVNDVDIGGSARCLTPCSECDKKKIGTHGGGCGIPVSAGTGCGIPVSGGNNFNCNATSTAVASTIMNDGEKLNASVNDVVVGDSARCLTPCSECDKKKIGTHGGGCGIPVSGGAGCGIPVSGGEKFDFNETATVVVSTIMNDGEKMNASVNDVVIGGSARCLTPCSECDKKKISTHGGGCGIPVSAGAGCGIPVSGRENFDCNETPTVVVSTIMNDGEKMNASVNDVVIEGSARCLTPCSECDKKKMVTHGGGCGIPVNGGAGCGIPVSGGKNFDCNETPAVVVSTIMNDGEKMNASMNDVVIGGSARCLTPCSECDKKKISTHGGGCGIPVSAGAGCGIPVSGGMNFDCNETSSVVVSTIMNDGEKMNATVNDVIIGGSARCLTPCSECDKKKIGTKGGGCGIPVSAGAGCGIPVSGGMNFDCNETPAVVVSTIMNDGEKMNASVNDVVIGGSARCLTPCSECDKKKIGTQGGGCGIPVSAGAGCGIPVSGGINFDCNEMSTVVVSTIMNDGEKMNASVNDVIIGGSARCLTPCSECDKKKISTHGGGCGIPVSAGAGCGIPVSAGAGCGIPVNGGMNFDCNETSAVVVSTIMNDGEKKNASVNDVIIGGSARCLTPCSECDKKKIGTHGGGCGIPVSAGAGCGIPVSGGMNFDGNETSAVVVSTIMNDGEKMNASANDVIIGGSARCLTPCSECDKKKIDIGGGGYGVLSSGDCGVPSAGGGCGIPSGGGCGVPS